MEYFDLSIFDGETDIKKYCTINILISVSTGILLFTVLTYLAINGYITKGYLVLVPIVSLFPSLIIILVLTIKKKIVSG